MAPAFVAKFLDSNAIRALIEVEVKAGKIPAVAPDEVIITHQADCVCHILGDPRWCSCQVKIEAVYKPDSNRRPCT